MTRSAHEEKRLAEALRAGEILNKSNTSRLDNLLLVRVVATLVVVFGHSGSFFGAFKGAQFPPYPYWQSQAVTVFFLVSGYTIAWVCERDSASGKGFSNFLLDRYARLAVPLFPILILIFLVETVLFESHPYKANASISTLLGNYLFLQNISLELPLVGRIANFGFQPFGTNRPLWTISLEFWIYIAYAGFFFAAIASSRGRALIIASAGLFGLAAINSELIGGRGVSLPLFWLAGAATYYVLRNAPILPFPRVLPLIPLAIYFAAQLFVSSNWPKTGTYSHLYSLLWTMTFFVLILIVPPISGRFLQVTRFFSSFAYTTYLAHYPILYWLWATKALPRGTTSAIIAAVVSVLVSWLLGLLFERNYKSARDWVRCRLNALRSRPHVGQSLTQIDR